MCKGKGVGAERNKKAVRAISKATFRALLVIGPSQNSNFVQVAKAVPDKNAQ